jgi:hypothetical protein
MTNEERNNAIALINSILSEMEISNNTTEVEPFDEAADTFKLAFDGKALKKNAVLLDYDSLEKSINVKFANVKPGDTDNDTKEFIKLNLSSNVANKLQFGKPLKESVEYLVEFFGSKKDSSEVKVDGYKLHILGSTDKGYPVAECDKIKVKGKKVIMFGNQDYSLFTPGVVRNIASMASVVDYNYTSMISQSCTIYRSKNDKSSFTYANIGELDYVQGRMMRDGNNSYIDIICIINTKNTSEMSKFGVMISYCFGDRNIYLNTFKAD